MLWLMRNHVLTGPNGEPLVFRNTSAVEHTLGFEALTWASKYDKEVLFHAQTQSVPLTSPPGCQATPPYTFAGLRG